MSKTSFWGSLALMIPGALVGATGSVQPSAEVAADPIGVHTADAAIHSTNAAACDSSFSYEFRSAICDRFAVWRRRRDESWMAGTSLPPTTSTGIQTTALKLALEGLWVANDSTSGLAAVAITQRDANWFVEAWGVCEPENCYWPRRPLQLNEPPLLAPVRGTTTWEGSIERSATFEVSGGLLEVDLTVRFHDNSGRKEYQRAERLRRAFEAGAVPSAGPMSNLSARVRDAYEREFGASVRIPAVFNDDRSVDCQGNGHLTSTAYARNSARHSTLLEMFASRDGVRVTHKRIATVMTPAGTFKTLVVIVRYSTIGADALSMLKAAQAQINDDHAAFARSRQYVAPLVVFDNTNVVLQRDAIGDPHDGTKVRAAVEREGIPPQEFDFVVVIDLDPEHFSGGLASGDRGDVYLGNAGHWTDALNQSDWTGVARAVYHHEIAHHWGWVHDWSPTCGSTRLGFEPFLAAPALFGWEDLDGDGSADILRETGSDR
jgi:hypothetical protein